MNKKNNEGSKKAKGINKNIVKKKINHKEYINILFEKKQIRHEMKRVQDNCHPIRRTTLTEFHYHALMIRDIYLMMELKL